MNFQVQRQIFYLNRKFANELKCHATEPLLAIAAFDGDESPRNLGVRKWTIVNNECEFEILADTLSARRLLNLSMLCKGRRRLKY